MNLTARLVGGIAIAAVAGYIVTGVARSDNAAPTAARAQLAAADATAIVKERQGLMKQQGKEMKTIAQFVESGNGTADDVAKNAAAIVQSSGEIVELFPAGTGIDDGIPKTGAKQEIWDDPAGFEAAANRLGELAGALEQVATSGDKQEIAAAFGDLGKNGCGGCHTKFRQKLD